MITGVEKCIQETGIKEGGDVCVKEKTNKRRCDKVYEIVNITENGGEELVFFLYNARRNEQLMKLKGGDYKFTSLFGFFNKTLNFSKKTHWQITLKLRV